MNAHDGMYGDILQAAARNEDNSIPIRALLDADPDVNIIGGHHGNSLLASCFAFDRPACPPNARLHKPTQSP